MSSILQDIYFLFVAELILVHVLVTNANLSATLQVKVFAWSPFGDQFFWCSKTFYKSSRQL